MRGLGILFKSIYGVELIDTGPGPNEELWHSSVKKVAVREDAGVSAQEGMMDDVGLDNRMKGRVC